MFDALCACLPQAPEWHWDWEGLRALSPIANAFSEMARTQQNPKWHGEGDVFAHTRLVCEALCGMPAYRALKSDAATAIALAALLHDIGKTRCTRFEGNRWRSPHHASTGSHLARVMLWREFGLCGTPKAQQLRETICRLIALHMQPAKFLEAAPSEATVLKLASDGELMPQFTMDALCLLAEADARGRLAPDVDELVESVSLFRELCRESGCLNRAYPFPSPHTARVLFKGGNVWKDEALYDDTWGEVILMCGLPGTGKDTWLHAHCPSLPTVCLDDIRRELNVSPTDNQGRVVQLANERARQLLRRHQPFAWNATNVGRWRQELIGRLEAYGARVRVVWLETDWDENLRRNEQRRHSVPPEVIDRMLAKLEPPLRAEAQSVSWLCV